MGPKADKCKDKKSLDELFERIEELERQNKDLSDLGSFWKTRK
jgi:hypothetical protein